MDLPPGPDNKRRQKLRRGFPTRRAAEDARRGDRPGQPGHPGRARTPAPSQYLEEWLEGLSVSRQNSTVENYGNVLRSWVIPRIGGLRLSGLEPGHLRKLYQETDLVFTREDGSGWHPQSLRHACLHLGLQAGGGSRPEVPRSKPQSTVG